LKINGSDRLKNVTKPLILKTICFTFIALTFSVLSSCATNKDTDFLDINSGAIENDLKLSKSKFKKFSIKKVSPDKKNKPRPSTTLEKDKKDSQTKGGGTGSQKSKQEKLDLGAKDKVVAGSLFYPYPSNYPEALKKYDKISLKTWSLSRPKIFLGEKFTFRVAYLGITAGHIQMETLPIVEIGDREAYHFKAHMRSARYYSYIYKLDDSLESFASVGDFIPMKYVLLQRESGQKVDDVQLFDREELKTYHFYKRLKKGKTKELEIEKPIPRFFQDSFSALHFVRGFPMNKGDLYEFPIVTRGKIWILKIKVEGKETIDVNGTDVLAFRLNAETRFPGVLEKKGDILFWYSADKDKKLLKFEAQVKIGAVRGELVDYTPGRSIETL
jgi:hypothetical protein